MKGKVYLVGAGVGDQQYLSVRGKELLNIAEVLVYDALAAKPLLNLVPADCLKLNVGKRGGKVSTPQTEINSLLVKHCLQGKQIVRLKSGDPFIFGRANEEISALEAAGCTFELVPGISSALAAPLLAGIPLTDKHLSRCFAVVSGHQPEQLDWSALAKLDTLVILMGGKSLEQIIKSLLEHGRSPQEPIAIIRNGGRIEQETWLGTLADIADKISARSLSPAVIVIGKVISKKVIHKVVTSQHPSAKSFQTEISPTETLPLADKTVLVTRAAGQSSKFTALLQRQGAKVLEMPALVITPPSSWNDLDQAIANLSQFQWLILTSANGVNFFFDRMISLGHDARALGGVKIAVVGRKTAAVLKAKQLNADFIPLNFVADSLVDNFPEALTGQKILFPRVETGGREVLVQELSRQGAEVVEVAAYQSKCPDTIEPNAWKALQQQQVDILTFASSKTVKNFYQLLQRNLPFAVTLESTLANVCIASIGPQTSKTCLELLGRFDLEAAEYTLEGLTTTIASNKFN